MGALNIELCPETGICSMIRGDGSKIDLMPDEVAEIREAAGNPEAIRQVLTEVDDDFVEGLDTESVSQIASTLK